MAVDGAGNVYIADTGNNAIKEWNVTTQQVTTLVSSGLNHPEGVAVDGAGNVYIADTGNNAIKEWNAATQQVTTLVSSGLNHPYGVAVDGAGNVYIADTSNNAIKEWNATTQQLTTLVSSGLNGPRAWRWTGLATSTSPIRQQRDQGVERRDPAVTTLISSGLNFPTGRGGGRGRQRLYRPPGHQRACWSGTPRPSKSPP